MATRRAVRAWDRGDRRGALPARMDVRLLAGVGPPRGTLRTVRVRRSVLHEALTGISRTPDAVQGEARFATVVRGSIRVPLRARIPHAGNGRAARVVCGSHLARPPCGHRGPRFVCARLRSVPCERLCGTDGRGDGGAEGH